MTRNPAAQTAFGPMVLAGIEHNEPVPRRLVDDDLATSFLPAAGRALIGATRWPALRRLLIGASERSGPGMWASLACRKRYIDEKLDEALADVDAVVVLGAGLDTRGCRLARHSDIPVYEVDLPVTIVRKAKAIQRVLGGVPASVRLVPMDFERDDLIATLGVHGCRMDGRTLFIWEGVTQYLTDDAVRATMLALNAAAPGSRLVFTYVQRDFIDGVNLYGAKSLYARFRRRRQVWHFGIRPDDVEAFLAEYGWRLVESAGPDYFVRHYIAPAGRDLTASQLEWTAYAQKN